MDESPFKKILSVLMYIVLPVGAIIWPFFVISGFGSIIFTILAQILGIAVLALIVEKASDNDEMGDLMASIVIIGLFVVACYWPFIVAKWQWAILWALGQIALISIGLDIISDGDLDFFEIVFIIALSLIGAYWPWYIFPAITAVVIIFAEAGTALYLVGSYAEYDTVKNLGISLLALVAIGWPWLYMDYNIAIIVILAELFALAFIYEIFRSFEDQGIVIGMFVFLMLLAVGWPWLAFIGKENYIVYSLIATAISGSAGGIIAKIVISLKG